MLEPQWLRISLMICCGGEGRELFFCFGPCPDQNLQVATKGVYRAPFATITIAFARIFRVESVFGIGSSQKCCFGRFLHMFAFFLYVFAFCSPRALPWSWKSVPFGGVRGAEPPGRQGGFGRAACPPALGGPGGREPPRGSSPYFWKNISIRKYYLGYKL